MVKVSVFYPNRKDARFDIDYYCNRHMPLVQQLVLMTNVARLKSVPSANGEPRHLAASLIAFLAAR